jgi:ADP-ribose pyrophosphatase YjhB (NUDIX family)
LKSQVISKVKATKYLLSSKNKSTINHQLHTIHYFYQMDIQIIKAGGGLVFNENDELLMIFRRGFWDLPKGKLDEGETIEACAVREIQEETGLQEVTLGRFIGITQHQYFDTFIKKQAIKESHWYEMTANRSQVLHPQTEEDITDIRWVSKTELPQLLAKSYPSIVEIVNKYLMNNQ